MSIVVSSVSFAQGTSSIIGTVFDAENGKPMADVVVTATSPAMQGSEVVVTDAAGVYRIAQLPPGVFKLLLEKEAYKPFERADITLRADRTVRVNIQLQPETVQGGVIEIIDRAPIVDVGTTNTGISVGKEFMSNIAFITPNANGVRSFESLAAVAPQVSADTYGFGFSGAQSPENLYLVDGVSTGDPAFGTNGAQFPIEFVEEANVITGGYQAEYGRATGGVLNVVTKSGSNEFHGAAWANYTPGILTGTSPAIKNDAQVIVAQNRLWNNVDFGADIGGPIVKDRLWFYAGFSPSFLRTQSTQTLRRFLINAAGTDFEYDADGTIKSETLPGTLQTRFNDTRSFSYIAKLTFLINAANNLSLSVVGSPTSTVVPFAFQQKAIGGGALTRNDTNTVSLKYQGGFFDKRLLVDATLGWFHLYTANLPNDGSTIGAAPGNTAAGAPLIIFRRTDPHSILDFENLNPAAAALCEPAGTQSSPTVTVRGESRALMACPATGGGSTYLIGGFGGLNSNVLDRLSGHLALTYLMSGLGHHVWKAGLDVERLSYDITKAFSGGEILRESTSGTSFADYRQYGYFTGPDTAQTMQVVHSVPTSTAIGAFVQDSWAILDLVTVNAGVRYEAQQLFAADGTLGLSLNNELSPRIGIIYDPGQQGRSKLFANYSRFYEAMPIDIADRALTGESQYQFSRSRTATANRQGCDPLKDFNQVFNECKDPNNYRVLAGEPVVNLKGVQTGAGKTPVDPAIMPQSSDEVVVGGEYEIITDGRLSATYTKRWLNAVVEDMSLDEASTYFLGNPGYGLATAFPKATRDYDAITGSFTKAFSDGWMGQVSYTWSYLRGNYNGLFRPETAQLDPNINSDFDLVSLLANRNGPLGANRSHFIKAYAAKEFMISGQFGVVIGLTYTGNSGTPINYLASHPTYGPAESFVLPRGSGGNLPWVHSINAKVGLTYHVSKDSQIQFTADLFNLFNFQAVTAVDQTISSTDILPYTADPTKNAQAQSCIAGSANAACKDGLLPWSHPDGTPVLTSELNSNFKRPLGYQTPISVRFGARFTF